MARKMLNSTGKDIYDMMRPKYIAEKNRIFKLKLDAKEKHQQKLSAMKLLDFCGIEKSATAIDCDNYYKALDKYLHAKIMFWTGAIDRNMKKGMKEKLQETMAEWLETGWAYLGQEHIEEESDAAKKEFEFMKIMCEQYTPKRQKVLYKKHKRWV
tara:strand:+ start:427 stop:891 length:465 start_codon:yes stop_codon:yes gene_type:complete